MKKLLQNIKVYLTLIAIIAVAVLLIISDFLKYGLIVLGAGMLFIWAWDTFVKKKEDEISKLNEDLKSSKAQEKRLENEVNTLRHQKLNVVNIQSILDLGLMEIDTNFTRTWNEKFTHENKSVHFIGALQVKVIAKYGIDLKELRIKFDANSNTIYVANVNPKFISFNDLEYHWKIAEIMEYQQPFFGANHWRKSSSLQELGVQIQENFRTKTHQEVKNGPEELSWITTPVKKQIANTLEIFLGAPNRTIEIVDAYDESFQLLENYSQINEIGNK